MFGLEMASLEREQLIGLLHLSTGFGSFLTLLLGLRAVSNNKKALNPTLKTQATQEDNAWQHKEKLEIVDIVSETHDIKTFRFQRKGGKSFPAFTSGQFLSFQIGENEKSLRSYSISSSVTHRELLQISVKKLPNGLGSGWFHDRKIGDEVWGFPPSGLFTDSQLTEVPRVYVAGGIGITPLLSMIATNLDRVKRFPMFLFYGVRSQKDIAFHSLLNYLSERYPNFHYYPVLGESAEGWTGKTGRISAQMIQELTGKNMRTHYFFCGPPPMTNPIMEDLLKEGVSIDQIHSEKFASPQAFDPEKIPTREVKVSYNNATLQYNGKQTLLEFLESQGFSPSFACRVGVCGTCKSKAKGKVHTLTDSGLTQAERRDGLVLTCVAYPLEDIEL